MKNNLVLIATAALVFSFKGCSKTSASDTPPPPIAIIFDSIPIIKKINFDIKETSGIADSKLNSGYLWAQEDSDTPTQLHLINHNGNLAKKIYIKNVLNRDWEDMSLTENEIYIGDIGDNNEVHSIYNFYKFPEPLLSIDTVYDATKIQFVYPDGSHDAEGFLVDPETKDIYIITKRDQPSKIYKLTYPYKTVTINATTFAGSLNYSGVVSAAISPNGKEIIIKTYTNLFYYTRNPNESISETLKKAYSKMAYVMEPQGEAVSFAMNNSGFFTLSEKAFSSSVSLYFYPRK